jgi:hypothetical protein
MMQLNLPAGEALLDVSCVEAMRLRFDKTIDPISLRDLEPATGPEPFAFTPPESLMVDRAQSDPGEIEQTQQMNCKRTLRGQLALPIERRLRDWLHLGVHQIARAETQSMAEALHLDSRAIEPMLRRWLSTSEIPETLTDSDAHWREIHVMGPE